MVSCGFSSTLYGLRTNAAVRIRFDCESKSVVEVVGVDVAIADVDVSDSLAFNLPQFLSVAGLPYFPSRYEFSKGSVWYHSRRPPSATVRLVRPFGTLSDNAKEMRVRLTPRMLASFDKPRSLRPRALTQVQVMGKSAASHALELINRKELVLSDDAQVQWHWCHLVAFTMLPEHRAQQRRNLFAGTAACNGQMANIEAAVKLFVYQTNRPVSLEVTASVLAGTHVAHRVRYRMWESHSNTLFTEYFDALNDVRSDASDFELVYQKLMASFQG